MKKSWGNFVQIIRFTVLTLFSIIWLIPIAWMISCSFTPNSEVYSWPIQWIPQHPTLGNYIEVFSSTTLSLFKAFQNNLIIVSVQVSVILFIDALAAYAFARMEFLGKNIIFAIIVGSMIIPGYMLVVPLYLLMRDFNLVNTLPGIFLPGLPRVVGVFLLRQFFAGVPKEFEDAARIDGASSFRIFLHVIIPVCKPALVALGIITFLYSWNNFLWPLIIINDPYKMNLPVAVAYLLLGGEAVAKMANIMAGTFSASLPAIIFFIFAQRHIVKGIALSGIK